MGKAPAFQFYVKDWLSDPQLKQCSFSTKGIWIDLLCFMWDAPERGKLESTVNRLCKMIGARKSEFELFITEATELSFCDISVTGNGPSQDVTLINRRMNREVKQKENNRLRQQRHREKRVGHAEITQTPYPTTK